MVERENILVVEVDTDTYDDIASVLNRISFDVDRIPTATAGLELVSLVGFRAIIVNHSLKTMSLGEFLTQVKEPHSASREASVGLLVSATESAFDPAAVPDGVNAVIRPERGQSDTEQQLCALLGIAHRAAVRVMVKIDVTLGEHQKDCFVVQTNDLSASGFFAITNRLAPVGSRANVTFNFPGEQSPFTAEAEVARHSVGARSEKQGMGLRFTSFRDGDVGRLSRYLESLPA